ncbi:hypothetical protein P7L53_02000 [Thermoleptolyngbya sichuanensis XZ-Cy5]|uniref:hypothetical protein n=1 Tax=Thermoleptolyngbya sichuanensis TaxID=2885951 RepID=UPI00240D7248|nr:hypothetical protein [Thermoleptolyngbya sichuanensis]MDG2615007.1 hypothetical protein [Thermoleptolyngbya sichuanensis XZ-Cy5]
MDIGDLVRLRQPFSPEPNSERTYSYGIIAGIVWSEDASPPSSPAEIVLYLYDLDTQQIYVDSAGLQAIYAFRPDELELM